MAKRTGKGTATEETALWKLCKVYIWLKNIKGNVTNLLLCDNQQIFPEGLLGDSCWARTCSSHNEAGQWPLVAAWYFMEGLLGSAESKAQGIWNRKQLHGHLTLGTHPGEA